MLQLYIPTDKLSQLPLKVSVRMERGGGHQKEGPKSVRTQRGEEQHSYPILRLQGKDKNNNDIPVYLEGLFDIVVSRGDIDRLQGLAQWRIYTL